MSKIQVNEIVNHFDTGAPDCPKGLTVTGFSTFTGGVSIGGTLTYEDVTNIDSVGLSTFQNGIHVTGGNVGIGTDNPGAKTHIDSTTSNTPLVVEASQNNRSRIVFRNNVETGTECNIELFDDDLRFVTNSGERLRITSAGQLNLAGNMQFTAADPELEFNNGGPRLRVPAANTLTIHTGGGLGATSNERLRINSSGIISIGATIVRTNWNDSSIEPKLFIEGAGDNDSTALCVVSNSGATNGTNRGASLILARTKGTTVGSNSACDDNTAIGLIEFKGNDGTAFSTAAKILCRVDGDTGTDDMPGELMFFTTADGSAVPTERVRIEAGGRIGLGPENQGSTTVCSTTQSAGTSNAVLTGTHSATTPVNGTVSLRLWNNGNIQNTNNSYGSLSDSKLKENIVNANSQWDDLKAIQVRNYNFKESTGHPTYTQLGVIAQEIETVSPGLVYETPDTDNDGNVLETVTKNVNYSVLYMKAVKALQEAMNRIETLEAKVVVLEGN